MILNNIDGSYISSFFCIILDTNETIASNVREKYGSTFTHEFIHYLQDLILPYNIRVTLSQLTWFLNIIDLATQEGYLKRPFRKWDENSKVIRRQYGYSIGNNDFIDKVEYIGGIKVNQEPMSVFDENTNLFRNFNLYQYSVSINDSSKPYKLGARDLLEYIAYKIEIKHYPSNVNTAAPDLPYKSVDLLFDYYGLAHIPDDIRVCVAEFCLYNDNPVRFLVQQFLDNDDTPLRKNHIDFWHFSRFLLDSTFTTTDTISESRLHKTNRRLEHLKTSLEDNYSNFPEIIDWISRINEFSKRELRNRFIFSEMYRMDSVEFEKFIDRTIDCIGVPLVMNKKGQYITLPSKESEAFDTDQFIHFYILQEFLAFMNTKSDFCPIENFCHCNYQIQCQRVIFDKKRHFKKNSGCPLLAFLDAYKLSEVKYKN